VQLEARFDSTVRRDLERRGHALVGLRAHDDAVGHSHLIALRDDGSCAVAADPRAESAALGH
jgi:hypothetical protein